MVTINVNMTNVNIINLEYSTGVVKTKSRQKSIMRHIHAILVITFSNPSLALKVFLPRASFESTSGVWLVWAAVEIAGLWACWVAEPRVRASLLLLGHILGVASPKVSNFSSLASDLV